MDAGLKERIGTTPMGTRIVGLAKAAAALHMAEVSHLRAHMLRPGDVGFEWSGELTIDEFKAVFGIQMHTSRAADARYSTRKAAQ